MCGMMINDRAHGLLLQGQPERSRQMQNMVQAMEEHSDLARTMGSVGGVSQRDFYGVYRRDKSGLGLR